MARALLRLAPALALSPVLALASAPAEAQCQTGKMTASDAVAGDFFGISVGVSGKTAVAGAEFDDENGINSGSAYVFERTPTGWTETQKLVPADNDFDDRFGFTVGISGDSIAATSRYNADLGYGTGSVYFFERQGATWVEVAKLLPSDAAPGTLFGGAVAIDGDRAIVGAQNATHSVVNKAGAAYVFERQGGVWMETAKLIASDPETDDRYGNTLALAGDTIVIGAFGEDSAAPAGGAVYVYELNGGTWVETAKLVASDAQPADRFGIGIGIRDGRLLVGSFDDGIGGADSGAVYAFEKVGGAWTEVQKLEPSDSAASQNFGTSISVWGDRALVGSWGDDLGGPSLADNGSAYLFEHDGIAWVERDKILPDDSAAGQGFGFATDMEGDSIVIGARGDSPALPQAGAAYGFSESAVVGQPLSTCPGAVSLSLGGSQSMQIDAGVSNGGKLYWILGSLSGVGAFPVDGVVLPLDVFAGAGLDSYLLLRVSSPSAGPVSNGLGFLAPDGTQLASFDVAAGTDPGLVGITIHHAYLTYGNFVFDFASNAAPVTLVP